jgi:hypothetical protein
MRFIGRMQESGHRGEARKGGEVFEIRKPSDEGRTWS